MMREASPTYILFAGINGAGKSTLFRSGLWTQDAREKALKRINPDEIIVARGWDSRDSRDQIRAGREAVRLVRSLLVSDQSFNQETTLSGRSILVTMEKAKAAGYRLVMHYVGLESPQLALARIAERVAMGGHDIPQEDVMRRFGSSRRNLIDSINMCDELYLYDNTEVLMLTASFRDGMLVQHEDFPKITWVEDILRVHASSAL